MASSNPPSSEDIPFILDNVSETRLSLGAQGEQLEVEANTANSSRYQTLNAIRREDVLVIQRAIDLRLDREVAIRRLSGSSRVTEEEHRQFAQEAKVAAKLSHPAILPVHDWFVDERGDACVVTNWIDGESLHQTIIGAYSETQSPITSRSKFDDITRCLIQRLVTVCDAVAHAHKQGFVHRNLNSFEILHSDDTPVIARWHHACEMIDDVQLRTSELKIVGSPETMPPEQARGKIDEVGPWSDIYSLGAILFEIATGTHPFSGLANEERLRRIRLGKTESARKIQPAIPPSLVAIIEKAMALDIGQRYVSASALASDLRAYLEGQPVSAYRDSIVDRSLRWCRRHTTVAASVSSMLAVSLIASIIAMLMLTSRVFEEREARAMADSTCYSIAKQQILDLDRSHQSHLQFIYDLRSIDSTPGVETVDRAIKRLRTRVASASQLLEVKNGMAMHDATIRLQQAKTEYWLAVLLAARDQKDEAKKYFIANSMKLERLAKLKLGDGQFDDQMELHQRIQLEQIKTRVALLAIDSEHDADRKFVHEDRTWLQRMVPSFAWYPDRMREPNTEELTPLQLDAARTLIEMEIAVATNVERINSTDFEAHDLSRAVELARWIAVTYNDAISRRQSEYSHLALSRLMQHRGGTLAATRVLSQLITDQLEWSERSGAKRPYSLSTMMMNRAELYCQSERFSDANKDYLSALEIRRAYLGQLDLVDQVEEGIAYLEKLIDELQWAL